MNRVPVSVSLAVLVAAALVAAAFSPGLASGQSPLQRVEDLARMGRADEARAALVTWWDGDRESASRDDVQRGLWLRGRLTVDPVQASLDFQRLVVLYPSGNYTADALFRLAQASYAMGDEDTARGYVDTLVRDYPGSDARARAEAWLADAGPVPPPGDTPTRPVQQGIVPTDRPVDRTPPPSGEAVMNYYVQLGAFTERDRAMALAEEARAAGVDVRVVEVEGSRFTHVRAGRFAEREDAVELLEALTAKGLNAALVRDDRRERPIGN